MSVENARRAWRIMKFGLLGCILMRFIKYVIYFGYSWTVFLALVKSCSHRAKRLETTLFSERIDAQVIDCQEEPYMFFLKSRVLTIRYKFREQEIIKRFKCRFDLIWVIGESLTEEDVCLFDPSNPLSAIPYEIFDMYAKAPMPPIWIFSGIFGAPAAERGNM